MVANYWQVKSRSAWPVQTEWQPLWIDDQQETDVRYARRMHQKNKQERERDKEKWTTAASFLQTSPSDVYS